MPRGGRFSGQPGKNKGWTSREVKAARNENTGTRAERAAFIAGRGHRARIARISDEQTRKR